MPSRFSPIALLVLILAFAASALGVAAFWGLTRLAAPAPLTAEVRLHPLLLPSGLDIDPAEVAQFISERLAERANRDAAIRISMGEENVAKMIDVVFPRLLAPTVISSTFERIPPLRAVLALSELQASAQVTVTNGGDSALEDVAMTLPFAAEAENMGGDQLELRPAGEGPVAVRIGALAPGETRTFSAWFAAPVDDIDPGAIRLGARGAEGSVAVYGHDGWLGEALAATPWARWLVGAVLLAAAFAALGLLVAMLLPALRRRRAASS